jgi:hypothetical protein
VSTADAVGRLFGKVLPPVVTRESPQQGRQRRIPDTVEIPVDDALELLSNDRRRFAIRHVAEAGRDGSSVEIGPLAKAVASFELGVPPGQLNAKERKRVYVSLYQGHVKKLDAVGALAIVRGDREHPKAVGATTLTHDLDAIAAVLEDAFEASGGPDCPECGEPMRHALPAGGEAVPCGCTIEDSVPAPGVTWG